MLQVPDLLMIHSPIQTHLVIQYTHLMHQHLLRLESNIILVVLWLVCSDLCPSDHCICACHCRCATTFLQQREDGGITPPCLTSLTARAPTLHAGTLVLSYCVCLKEKVYKQIHVASNCIEIFLYAQGTSSVAPSSVAIHLIHSRHPSPWTPA